MTRHVTFILTISLMWTACTNQIGEKTSAGDPDTTVSQNIRNVMDCDTFATNKPKIKKWQTAYKVWLETTSLDWFIQNRQSAWREAKAWHLKTFPIDSNSVVKCLCHSRQNIFLYIPNHYYNQPKNGNEYFRFYIVNNSADTLQIPRLDNVINNISSSVSTGDTSKWLIFQQTDKFIECGNSIWTQKLPPRTAIQSEIESGYINVGDTTVDYRIQFSFGKQTIVSNKIKITLLKQQLPFLGKNFD